MEVKIPPPVIGIDGYQRSLEKENELNSMFAGVFARDAGARILDYLRSITMHAVVPPSEPKERLRHQEGMRDLFRIIQERTNKGKEGSNEQDSNSSGNNRSRRGRRKRIG
jgi:hypothetical protein